MNLIKVSATSRTAAVADAIAGIVRERLCHLPNQSCWSTSWVVKG
jgi:hypothetical protein